MPLTPFNKLAEKIAGDKAPELADKAFPANSTNTYFTKSRRNNTSPVVLSNGGGVAGKKGMSAGKKRKMPDVASAKPKKPVKVTVEDVVGSSTSNSKGEELSVDEEDDEDDNNMEGEEIDEQRKVDKIDAIMEGVDDESETGRRAKRAAFRTKVSITSAGVTKDDGVEHHDEDEDDEELLKMEQEGDSELEDSELIDKEYEETSEDANGRLQLDREREEEDEVDFGDDVLQFIKSAEMNALGSGEDDYESDSLIAADEEGEGSDDDEEMQTTESAKVVSTKDASAPAALIESFPKFRARALRGRRSNNKKKAEESAATVADGDFDDSMMPKLFSEVFLPKEQHEEITKYIGQLKDSDRVSSSAEHKANAQLFVLLMMNAALMFLDSIMRARDHSKNEDLVMQCIDGLKDCAFELADMRKLYMTSKSWWRTAHGSGLRKLRGQVFGNEEAGNVRPIDYAYTWHYLERLEEIVPKDFLKSVYSNAILAFIVKEMGVSSEVVFTVSEEDSAALGSDWKCAMTGSAIGVGDEVLCAAMHPDPTISVANRDKWIKEAVKHKAFADNGITSFRQFMASDYYSKQMLQAPLVFFVKISSGASASTPADNSTSKKVATTTTTKKPKKRKAEAMEDKKQKSEESMAPPKSSSSSSKLSTLKSIAAKRKATESAEVSEAAQKNGSSTKKKAKEEDASAPEKKKVKLVPQPDTQPLPVNYYKASPWSQGTNWSLKCNVKVRELTAHQVDGGGGAIAPGAAILLTEAVTELLSEADKMLFRQLQVGARTTSDSDKLSASAQQMLDKLFEPVEYDGESSNTAQVMLKKMQDGNMDKQLFVEWLRLLICSFVDPLESKLLSAADITGRARMDTKADSPIMRINELPYGRHLTDVEWTTQLARVAMFCIHDQLLSVIADGDLNAFSFAADDDLLYEAFMMQLDTESKYTEEQLNKELHERQKKFSRALKADKKAHKEKLVECMKKLRKEMHEWKPKKEYVSLPQTLAFIGGRVFPRFY